MIPPPPPQQLPAGELTNPNLVARGVRLGSSDLEMTSLRVRVGGSACEATNWLASSAVHCKLADGIGSYLSVVLTVASCVYTAAAAAAATTATAAAATATQETHR